MSRQYSKSQNDLAQKRGYKDYATMRDSIRARNAANTQRRLGEYNEKHGTNLKTGRELHYHSSRNRAIQHNKRADAQDARNKRAMNSGGVPKGFFTPADRMEVKDLPSNIENRDTRYMGKSSSNINRSKGSQSSSGLNTGASAKGSWGVGSKDYYGHADYERDKRRGMTDAQIKSLIDKDPSKMGNGGVTGDLYKQIASGAQNSGGSSGAQNSGNSNRSGGSQRYGQNNQRGNQGNSNNSGFRPNNTANASNNVDNTQEQNVNQDNDITTSINGDNNNVFNNQDNSIRQYGGDNRSFVYASAGNGYADTPVSAATMNGFYGVDDSPAAQAKFNDMYTTMNRDNQKRFAGEAMQNFAKYGKYDARDYTPEAMQTTLGKSTQYSFDRADRQTGHVFGDIWNPGYINREWKMPTAPDPIESNAGDIADKAKKDIEDM